MTSWGFPKELQNEPQEGSGTSVGFSDGAPEEDSQKKFLKDAQKKVLEEDSQKEPLDSFCSQGWPWADFE